MEPVQIFDIASQQARWLSVRQAAVAGNIANANTPGYKSVDVEPFEKVLANRSLALAPTRAGHIPIGAHRGPQEVRADQDAAVSASGNTVTVEQELVKAGEVRHGFEINTAIVRSFHRMLMMTVKI